MYREDPFSDIRNVLICYFRLFPIVKMHHLTGGRLQVTQLPKHLRKTKSLVSIRTTRSADSYVVHGDKFQKDKIVINVGGALYETLESTLNKYPETLLGSNEKRSLLIDKHKNEIFLNRNRSAFEAILFYYQSSGNLVRPAFLPMIDFVDECAFYDIPEDAIKKMKTRECYLHKRRKILPPREKYSRMKESCWTFFDHPLLFKNISAICYFVFSFMLIIVSIALFCTETEFILAYEGKDLEKILNIGYILELSLNIFFTVELLVRWYVYPPPRAFLSKALNFVEFLTVFTYLILYGGPTHFVRTLLLQITRMLRVLRLARAARVSRPIKVATSVFHTSINDVSAVCFVSLILCILSGSVMYYIEMTVPNTKFTSIPESMWWAMQSLLCLGYGDIVPETMFGKAVGSMVVFLGVVTVTVLLLSLGGRLFDMYSKEVHERGFLPEEEKVDYEIHYKDID